MYHSEVISDKVPMVILAMVYRGGVVPNKNEFICDWILENQLKCQFHFIGPANSYTHTLPIHSAITRLS